MWRCASPPPGAPTTKPASFRWASWPTGASTSGCGGSTTADPVPPERRAQLAADDLARRRNIAERDPANVMSVRFFGQELSDRLVRTLWGGDRVLPRPG